MRSAVDTSRLGEAIKRPGIDPRVWLTLAVVKAVSFDSEEGIFVDVQFLPDGHEETCILGSPYSSDSAGFYFPVEVDDVVIVAVPNGDTGAGPVIVSQLWNKTQKPSSEMGSGTEPSPDVTLRLRSGRKCLIVASDSEITIKGEGSTKVIIQAASNVDISSQADVNVSAQNANIVASGTAVVQAPVVKLGPSPASPVGRVGDAVSVTLPSLAVKISGTDYPVVQSTVPSTLIVASGTIVSGQVAVIA